MKTNLFLIPDGDAGLPTPAAAPAKPAAAPSPAPVAAPASASPIAAPPIDDDPFSPPKKPDGAAGKPADGKASIAPVDFDKLAPKELRERVKQLNAEKEKSVGTIQSLETRIKELDSRGVDTTALTTRLEALEKERDAAHAELRAARQEASPEFKEKYDKPFNNTAERVKSQIQELTVTNAEDGTTRTATWQDFAELYSLPVGKAIERANALFGNAANFVLQQREKLLDLDTARRSALEEEKAQFKQRSAKEIAEQAVKRESVGKLWRETNKRLADSVEDYKNDSTDTEAADARKHALSVFDAQINAADQDDFMNQKVLKDAHVRQRVGAYAVQKVQISRLKSENESLKKQIGELKGAAPGSTQRPGGAEDDAPETDENWGAELVKQVRG